ncbi:hypothetical protein ZWY2020_058248 [Hordeum vulgare]|nr:hypothetical protein ZWY2020_058248 [Hordeum vulgare]
MKSCELGAKYVNLENEKKQLQLDLEVTTNDQNLLKQALEDKDKACAKAKEKTEVGERKLAAVGKLEEENNRLKQEWVDYSKKLEHMTKRRNDVENYLDKFAKKMFGMLTDFCQDFDKETEEIEPNLDPTKSPVGDVVSMNMFCVNTRLRKVKEPKNKKYKDESSDDSKKKKKSSKSSSHKKTSFRKARALIVKEMVSEEESKECDEEEGFKEDSESGVASFALATIFVSKSIFNLEENDNAIYTDDYVDDVAPTYSFMAKGSKVPNETSSPNSNDSEPDDYKKPSYTKLAHIATKQQSAIEKLQKLLDRSDDMLNDEMNHTQILTEGVKSLQSKLDSLQDRYGTLLADHEKLSSEFLQRKLDLEKLKMSHDDLRMENDSLLAQQISAALVEFTPPCLKCIERETVNSSPESSNASIATNS